MTRIRHQSQTIVALSDDAGGRKFYAVHLGVQGILVLVGAGAGLGSYELDPEDIDALGAMLDLWRKDRGASPRGVTVDPDREGEQP